LVSSDYKPYVSRGMHVSRDTYSNFAEYYQSMPGHLMQRASGKYQQPIIQVSHTFHNCPHTTYKAMDHTQRLCDSHLSLILGQSIQSLEYGLYLAVPQQSLCEFLCGTLNHGQCICNNTLTEPTLFDLLRRQSKHREQFSHYFEHDLHHYRSGRDCRIDLQTLEETPYALEELEDGIIA
jgi:hypothetical protein